MSNIAIYDVEPTCASCGRVLKSTISRGYGNSRQPKVGYCGMCARDMRSSAQSKGEGES